MPDVVAESQETVTEEKGGEPNEFDAAWEEANQVDSKEASEKAEQKAEGKEPTEEEKVAESEKKVEDGKKEEAQPAKDKKESPETDKYAELEHKHKTLEGMYNSLIKEVKELKENKEVEKEKPEQKAEEIKKAAADNLEAALKTFSDSIYADLDEATKTAIKEYEEEFDTTSKIEDTKRLHALKKTIAFMEERTDTKFAQFAKDVKKAFDTVLATLDSKEEQSTHYKTIKDAHPDFETYRDSGDITAWIETKTPAMKKAYTAVYKEGSPEEVIDLIAEFKKEKGLLKEKIDDEDGQNGHDKEKEQKQKDRKENLTTVKGRQAGISVTSGGVPQDYDSAWEEASRQRRR